MLLACIAAVEDVPALTVYVCVGLCLGGDGLRYAVHDRYNLAGMAQSVRSVPITADATPPSGGWVHDLLVLDEDAAAALDGDVPQGDADFGDASQARFQARWGGWEDFESPDLEYTWAVMRVDPRQVHVTGSIRNAGSELASVVTKVLADNPDLFSVDAPIRPYTSFRGSALHEVDNGVVVTAFVPADGPGFGDRIDIEIITGFWYFAVLRVQNGHGLATLATSDGMLFDRSEPCVSEPYPGLDPTHRPAFLSTEDEVSAVWAAKADPRHQLDVPFECASGDPTTGPTNSSLSDVPVVPVWRMAWQVREVGKYNATGGFNATLANITGQINTTNPTAPDEGVVVVPPARVGGDFASPWSGCCSAYSELDPQRIREEWDWRPTVPLQRFGHELTMVKSRFVGVGGSGTATVFDVLHSESTQHYVTAEEVHAAAGSAPPASDTALMHLAGHDMFVFATAQAISVRDTPPELPHGLDDDASDSLTNGNTMAVLASLPASSPLFSGAVDGSGFTTTTFAGAVATRGRLLAVSTSGVWQGGAARAVVVLHVSESGGTTRVGMVASVDASFGESIAFARASEGAADTGSVMFVATPATCTPALDDINVETYTNPCTDPTSPTPTMRAYNVDADSPSVTLMQAVPLPPTAQPSAAFGASMSAAGNFVVIGDAQAASGVGEVSVLSVTSTGIVPVCVVPGMLEGSGFGYSVAIADAHEEGKTGIGSAGRNDGTALVVAGAPGGNAAAIIRVNASNESPCKIVASVRQSSLFRREGETVPPLYGAGTAVAMGGGMVVFSAPYAHTWPGIRNATLNTSMTGTGRVFGASFCWAGDVRSTTLAATANVPSICTPCGVSVDSGEREWSSGGLSRTCETCEAVECLDSDESYFSAQASTPLNLDSLYQVDVIATSRSGRSVMQTSQRFQVDWTPPTAGVVRDALLLPTHNVSTSEDISVQTDATYLAASWCCFLDDQSGVTGYQVAFGTAPDTMDIMEYTPVGLNRTFVLHGQSLVTGQRYYACVVASNTVGLFSEPACTDGFMYDDTAPAMVAVRDGFQFGYDVDAQPFLDLMFANYEGVDAETRITDYVVSFGRSPGVDDIATGTSGGNSTMNGVAGGPFVSQPVAGDIVYANVYAVNEVGLVSAVMSSDGIAVGKSDVSATPDASTSMLLDTIAITGDNATSYDPPQTVAGVTIPPGAVDEQTTFFGGSVTDSDVNSGGAVNVSETTPRNVRWLDATALLGAFAAAAAAHTGDVGVLQNLRFGEYSFTLEARDPDTGDVITPFVFGTPVRITMLCEYKAAYRVMLATIA